MKNKNISRFSLASLLVIVALLGLLAALALPAMAADQQGYPSTFFQLTNVPTVMSNATTSAFATNYIPVHANSGLSVETRFTGQNTNAGSQTLYFYPTEDGSNFWTAPFATVGYSASGTNLVIGGTNWPPNTLRGWAGIGVTVSNAIGGTAATGGIYTNPATGWTNGLGLFVNRPNQ